MAIVTAITLVLDVRGVNGDTASLLLRCLVNLGVVGEARGALLGENLGDSGGQRGLAMVDVTDGADVAVRLVPLEFSLSHYLPLFAQ